jgi:hypothetical protein
MKIENNLNTKLNTKTNKQYSVANSLSGIITRQQGVELRKYLKTL